MQTMKRKALPLLLSLCLIVSLFSGLTITAAAWDGEGTQSNPYLIANEADLRELAEKVNGGEPYDGQYFKMSRSIELTSEWIPIGGRCGTDGSFVPDGKYFGGFFDGNGYDITGLRITEVTDATSYGLFGFINGGAAYNLSVTGEIVLGTGVTDYVGGIVGYTNGSVYNCHTAVNISVGGNAGNVGGIAGAQENRTTGTKVIKVQYCSASGDIKAARRIGGIVGGAYSMTEGGQVIDNCSYGNIRGIGGSLTTTNSSSKAYVGGIVGYTRGWISNTYANVTLNSAGGHYMAGNAALLQGANPMASLYYSYAITHFTGEANPNYDRPMFGSVDNSNILPINGCQWYVESPAGEFVQPVATGTNGWGNWTGGTGVVTSPSGFSISVLGSAFVKFDDLPFLTWQTEPNIGRLTGSDMIPSGTETPNNTPGGITPLPDTDDASMIFLNGMAADDGDGTKDHPYNNIERALADLNDVRNVIYVRGQVTLSDNAFITSDIHGATIKRSSTYLGFMFNVFSGATTLENIIIDGNADAFKYLPRPVPTFSLINVDAHGELIVNGAMLQNSFAGNAGAVRIQRGVMVMNSGLITNNQVTGNAGGVGVYGGEFTMVGGSITHNSAISDLTDGGGIAIYNHGVFTMNGGTISGNLAGSDGNGDGILVGDPEGMFRLVPTHGGTIADVIYLTDGRYIAVTGSLTALTGNLTVQLENLHAGALVAQKTTGIFSTAELAKFVYAVGVHTFIRASNNSQIVIQA